ncbi:hypothetical protein NBRC116583_08200 [Arenicella sp. 4NH20-0111]|uniref:hypothetical protein n=1 Tax=Arenicella sp. 4NH20-0111 TaxID=3127648 RepID=UPI00310B380B
MVFQIKSITLVTAFLVSLISSSVAIAQDSAVGVCSNNDYALCSHAQCQCIDDDGKPGACTEDGLAQCECPVVRHQDNIENSLDKATYNSNYGVLRSCDERANPQLTNVLPNFANDGTVAPDVYSEYSYGDSLNGRQFGTKSSAKLMICPDLPLMTDCLDAPCTIDDNGVATCYCINTQLTINQKIIPWNTVGGGCQPQNCDLGGTKVWSAAYVQGTQIAIDAIQKNLSELGQSFVSEPSYCN